MLSFAGALILMIATPGPGVLTTAGIGSGFGWAAGIRFLVGLFIGTNLGAVLTVSGLSAIVLAEPAVRTVLVWASIGWFGYLAARIALAGAKVGFIAALRPPRLTDGIVLQMINPKVYVVNTLLFGGFGFWGHSPAEYVAKFVIINVVWVPVHLAWLWAGVRVGALQLRPGVQRAINIAMAVSLVVVVGLSAWSLLHPDPAAN